MKAAWTEKWVGGSPEFERAAFEALARDIMLVQLKQRRAATRHGVTPAIDRAFHAKSTLTVEDAELRFLDLAPELRVEFAQPQAVYRTVVRFSNAAGTRRPDYEPDLRGVALRIFATPRQQHDLLMTNWPTSHARDARQFVEFAVAMAGGGLSRAFGVVRLILRFGPLETQRMVRNVRRGRRQKVRSVASQTYWSRGAIRWGDTLAVRYLLRPLPGTPSGPKPSGDDPDYLSHEITRRLAGGDVHFQLCIQRFKNARATPIEDTAVAWSKRAAPPEPVAVLTIGRRAVDGAAAEATARTVDAMAFNPWNTTERFRPLGNLNRARRAAYDASAAQRLALRWRTDPPLRNVILGAVNQWVFSVFNRLVAWYRLPTRLSLLNLGTFRQVLRRENLIDTQVHEAPARARRVPPPPRETDRVWRRLNGRSNDLSVPWMGAVGATFGRNLRPRLTPELFDRPNPIVVSRELLLRTGFQPARSLNLLAAAWIQFQVHDWVSHERFPLGVHDVEVTLPQGMPGWSNTPGGPPEPVMRIAGNVPARMDPPDGLGPRFENQVSHWWDGSEVYGSDGGSARRLRDGAKLRLTPKGYLPQDTRGSEITGFGQSWWLGLSGMHTLFAREHNLLCDELCRNYPRWGSERVYQTARLIVSALIAKIHTVEWTPAILATKALEIGMTSNWSGPPAKDWLTRLGIWLLDTHASVGIPATRPDHHGVPFSLTEDFVSVYRMHPLLPDDYLLYDHRTGKPTGRRSFREIQGDQADDVLRQIGLENLLYSFGLAHPGAVTLHNYPRSLTDFERDGEHIDLSVVDLVRDRHRGVPRYNDFRAGLHKPRIRHWEQLCSDPESVRTMRDLYGSIDKVDTMVGLFAETPPDGFGFSDTAFRIFILMASRRLQSDRFLTVDFRPEIYSPFGIDWVASNGMKSVILRHCPELAGVLPPEASAFAPWRPVPDRSERA
jgi:hypothetical protein